MGDDDRKTADPPAQESPPTQFAPSDYTDGRSSLDWSSKYPREARIQIRLEAAYLGVLLIVLPVVIVSLACGALQRPMSAHVAADYEILRKYLFALCGGAFGGALFSTKWLYHSVAKQLWHLDRRLWRLFTPLLSGGLAFVTAVIISAKVVSVFNQEALASPESVLAMSFLVGYFSDNATAKLSEIAETMFGATRDADAGRRAQR